MRVTSEHQEPDPFRTTSRLAWGTGLSYGPWQSPSHSSRVQLGGAPRRLLQIIPQRFESPNDSHRTPFPHHSDRWRFLRWKLRALPVSEGDFVPPLRT